MSAAPFSTRLFPRHHDWDRFPDCTHPQICGSRWTRDDFLEHHPHPRKREDASFPMDVAISLINADGLSRREIECATATMAAARIRRWENDAVRVEIADLNGLQNQIVSLRRKSKKEPDPKGYFKHHLVPIISSFRQEAEASISRWQKFHRRVNRALSRPLSLQLDASTMRQGYVLHKDKLGISYRVLLDLHPSDRDDLRAKLHMVAAARDLSQNTIDIMWSGLSERKILVSSPLITERVLVQDGEMSSWPAWRAELLEAEAGVDEVIDQLLGHQGSSKLHRWWKSGKMAFTVNTVCSLAVAPSAFYLPKLLPSIALAPVHSLNNSGFEPIATKPATATIPRQSLFRSQAERATFARLARENPECLVQVNRKLSQVIRISGMAGSFEKSEIAYLHQCEVDFVIYDAAGELMKVVEQQRGPHHDTSKYSIRDELKRRALAMAGVEFEETI